VEGKDGGNGDLQVMCSASFKLQVKKKRKEEKNRMRSLSLLLSLFGHTNRTLCGKTPHNSYAHTD
jgi:hypothetical protein